MEDYLVESLMSIEVLEHSAWLRVKWTKVVRGWGIGSFRFPDQEQPVMTEVLRLYPASFGLGPNRVQPKDVIEAGLRAGYVYCPDAVRREIASGRLLSRRRGYIVVPRSPDVNDYLLVEESGHVLEAESLLANTVESSRHWSVLLAKP